MLTHRNAGGLATVENGTAVSVFFTTQDEDKYLLVFVDETRPLLQGHARRQGQGVITGANHIAANG